MKVLLFGATGMVGQGVLRECLAASDVAQVITVGRTATGIHHARLREIVHPDLFDLSAHKDELTSFDACFFTLGVSSVGMTPEAYSRLTYDLTISIAELLSALNPQMVFVYVSGVGTDETEQGRSMWARVKGRTENALYRLPFKAAYSFRPAAIVPIHGERSKNTALRYFYAGMGWFLLPLRGWTKGYVLTTQEVGRAMLNIARKGWPTPVLEPDDIRAAAS
jgi:uncharacterized protein YbjT (DUF2867 family)